VGHLVEKCFLPKHAPKIPRVIEGAYINENPIRSYLIEEHVPGTPLSEDLFNNFSRKRQKLILMELAKTIAKMHFRIPDAYLKISRFPTKSYYYYPDPTKNHENSKNMASFLESEKLALTHSDLFSKNILCNGKEVTVIDFGRAWCGPRFVDFSSINNTYSENFTHRLMDAYTLVYGLFTKKWR
jgi:aminoglycoside phosphotransferase (APT) family kinase protein